MPLPIHVEITSSSQGKIEGSCDMEGREGTIFVMNATHELKISEESGGKRIHSPFCIEKEIDKSSPKLMQAFVSLEPITSVIIKWYRHSPKGHEEHYYTHKLENALLRSVVQKKNIETLHFSYEKITWTWEVDGIESSDTWQII
jgi:type VI secretion system secreted protein Hcp